MALLPTSDYVKFVRGSKQAFNALLNKAADTLYFIYDPDDSTVGSLYLGSRLIGGTGSAASSSLGDLKDIVLSTVKDKQILVFDASSNSWKNGTISDILGVDAVSIVKSTTGTLSLNGFDAAAANTIAIKQEDKRLGWATPTQLREVLDVFSKAEIKNLFNGSLSRKVVTSIQDINLEAIDAENYIYLVPNTSGTYDEYIVVNKKLEKMGDWNTDLSGYVTKAEVGDLVKNNVNTIISTSIGDLTNYGGDNITLVEKVEEIDNRLKWSEITTD